MADDRHPDLINALAQAYAASGAWRNRLEGDPVWPRLPPLPDNRPSLRSYDPQAGRPHDAMAPVAEMISPTMGAYGLAGLATTAGMDARQGKYDMETLAPLAAMALIPGGRRLPEPLRRAHPNELARFNDASERLYAWGSGPRDGPQVRVPIDALHATENTIYRKRVNEYKKGSVSEEDGNKTPLVAVHNGKLFIVDGHHKLTAMKEMGEKDAPVILYDFNNPHDLNYGLETDRRLTALPSDQQ